MLFVTSPPSCLVFSKSFFSFLFFFVRSRIAPRGLDLAKSGTAISHATHDTDTYGLHLNRLVFRSISMTQFLTSYNIGLHLRAYFFRWFNFSKRKLWLVYTLTLHFFSNNGNNLVCYIHYGRNRGFNIFTLMYWYKSNYGKEKDKLRDVRLVS